MRLDRRWIAAVALGGLALAGCARESAKPEKELSERQRDSIIATEKALPGSAVVGRALATSDSAAAQAKRMDQQGTDEGTSSATDGK